MIKQNQLTHQKNENENGINLHKKYCPFVHKQFRTFYEVVYYIP